MSQDSPNESMAPGSFGRTSAVATGPPSHVAGKQREIGEFTMERFLEEANGTLEKIKQTASNVTTCQCQIDQVFDRSGSLLEALFIDSASLEPLKVQEAAGAIEETLKDLHKHVLRFAIYGRPKAFVHRLDISSYFETFNIQIDSVLKIFAVAKHQDVEDWEGEYYQAKLDDEAVSYEQLWEILNNESDLKIIMEMGNDAMDALKAACVSAMDYPHTTATRKTMLENAVKNLEFHSYRDPGLMQPSTLLKEAPKNPTIARLATPSGGISRASSSTPTLAMSGSQRDQVTSPSYDPDETPGARAKREEADRERALALASGDLVDEPALPRWEPRRPPPGRGPGSVDETTEAARELRRSPVPVPAEQSQTVPGWQQPPAAGEDLPPSYS